MKNSGPSAEKSNIAYLRKLLWARYRWPAVIWFLAVLIIAWRWEFWANASVAEITIMLTLACIWFAVLLIIPVANYFISGVLSPRKDFEGGPCYDIALTHMQQGDFLAAQNEFLELLDDWPGDRVCYENLIEIYALHITGTTDLERLLKRAQTQVPPSMLKEFQELAEGHRKKAQEFQKTEKKKLDVDFIYDSEILDSVLHHDDD